MRSIVLQSRDEDKAPKNIKLFVNRPSIGFEDVEDASEPAAAQVLQLSSEDVKAGNRIALRFVRFQAVNSLHVGPFLSCLLFVIPECRSRYLFRAIMVIRMNHESMC